MQKTKLRFLSFNIEQGHASKRALDYVMRSWQHILPSPSRLINLNNIADLLTDYDVVALQEIDGGSIRSGHINQVKYLAEKADFPYWHSQLNRNLGRFAQHGNGVLSRIHPIKLIEHKLPGLFPGRGAILMELGQGKQKLAIVMLHLALGKQTRRRQIEYLVDHIQHYPHIIMMGDFNSSSEWLQDLTALRRLGVSPISEGLGTYPSWRPKVGIDHILVSKDIKAEGVRVLSDRHSDHLAIGAELSLPIVI